MIRVFKADPDKICVWAMAGNITIELVQMKQFLKEYHVLNAKEYYFAASSLTPQKNFKWLKAVAQKIRIVLLPLLVKLKDYLQLMIWIKVR